MYWEQSSCSRLNVSLLKANCRQKKWRRRRLSVVNGYREKSIKKITTCWSPSQEQSPSQTIQVLWQRGSGYKSWWPTAVCWSTWTDQASSNIASRTSRSRKDGTRPTQDHVTCGPRKHTVNLKTENLADPRETRSQTCYQKMRSLPKTASWTLRAENGPIAGRESFMFTSFRVCWNWFRRTSLCKRRFNHTESVPLPFHMSIISYDSLGTNTQPYRWWVPTSL